MFGLFAVSPLESQYAILDPELRAKAKREALGIPEKPVETKKVVKTTASKEVTKKKPSKDSGKENQLKTLPDALKLVMILKNFCILCFGLTFMNLLD